MRELAFIVFALVAFFVRAVFLDLESNSGEKFFYCFACFDQLSESLVHC